LADTVKVLQQTLNFKGPVAALQATLQTQGVRGLYRGVSTALWAAALEDAALFGSYEELKHRLGGDSALAMCVVVGATRKSRTDVGANKVLCRRNGRGRGGRCHFDAD